MTRDEMNLLLLEALQRLNEAAHRLIRPVSPSVPLPRPRVFRFAADVQWPYFAGPNWWQTAGYGLHFWSLDQRWSREKLAGLLLDDVGAQPRAVLRLIRRIDAAAAWCDARRRGRERAAAELLRQQAKATETLEAMRAVQAMGAMGGRDGGHDR